MLLLESMSAPLHTTPFTKELQYFLAISKTQNVSRAAETLGLQQATLSKALQNLEEHLGQKLFVRNSRGLKLTKFGEQLQVNLEQLQRRWEEGFSEAFSTIEEVSGVYRVGIHRSVAQNLLPDFMPQLLEQHPKLMIETVFATSREIEHMVAEYEIDFGIVANASEFPTFLIRRIREEFVSCWSQAKEPEPIVYYNPEMIEIRRILPLFHGHRLIPLRDYHVIAAVVAQSQGMAILPDVFAAKHGLKQVRDKFYEAELSVITRADQPRTKAFHLILDTICSKA